MTAASDIAPSKGFALCEDARRHAKARACYHHARMMCLDDEDAKLSYIADIFATSRYVTGVGNSPSTRDSELGDPLLVLLKGAGELNKDIAIGHGAPMQDMEFVPIDSLAQAVRYAREFAQGGSLPIF